MTLFSNAVDYSRFVPNYQENIGMAYAGGTFTVQGARAALSQDNAAYVGIQDSTTPGLQRIYRVVANQTFTDGAGGSTATQRFGLISGNVWGANDIPFFLYAVQNSAQTAIAFMISRTPSAKVAPAAASIGQSGAVVNVGQGDFFSLAAITTSNYAGQPATYLGCFRMQFTGGTNSWTVTALAAGIDGIGYNFNDRQFNFPVAVQGAAAGSFFLANGGTAPIWSAQQVTYRINRDGVQTLNYAMNTNTTAGVGAVDAILAMPYSFATSVLPYRGIGWFLPASNITVTFFPISPGAVPAPQCKFFTNGNAGFVSNAVLGAAGSTLSGNFECGVYVTQ